MDTLSLSDRSWKGFSKPSPQHGDGDGQPSRPSTTWRAYLPRVESLLARVRRVRAQVQNRKWIFKRESSRVAVEIPVAISGIDEHGRIFGEATHTIDVSRRGAKIATSNFLAVGTYLWIESPSLEKPTVAQVVRHGAGSRYDCTREICVALPEVDGPQLIWRIKSPPEDWQTGLGEPSAAKRLERIYAREWVARFESISKVAAAPTGFVKSGESQPEPAPASLEPEAPPSLSEKRSEGGPVSVTSQLEKPVHVYASSLVRNDEGAPSGPDQIREVPTSDIDERLTGLCLAVEALEGRVAALVEDFQGKGARQAEDLEKLAQELGGRVVEEGKRQLASLAEAKLASLSQATREEYDQQLAQAFGEHAQVMREAADAEVESIKQAAEQAIVQLQAAEQKRETSFIARAGAAEERLTGVSLAVEALVKEFQGKGARQAEDLEKIAQKLGGRVVEEGKRQLAQAFGEHAQVMREAADAEVESIKQVAEQAIAQLQVAEQKRETSFTARAGAAEERLTGVSLAVEALEGHVGALVEDFQGRIEGSLQAFQGKGARQAEDLEKIAQELGGRWTQQFQEQAETALEKLRKELKNSGRVVEESKRQLASLAEAKLASLSQATREEYDQQLAQAFGEHTQVMREAADAEVESIKQAAEQAIAQLQVAEQKRETSFIARSGAAEERLTGVSLAVEALEGRVGALVEDFQGKGARQAEDLEKITQELGGRWSEQFQEEAEAAVEKLREELKNSGRVVEEGKRQLASLAEAKLASLSQATREEYDQQLAQAFGEHAQVMQEAADAEVESIKQAAEQAIAQLQVAEQKRETSFIARAGAAEERLAGVSLAVEALEGRVGALVEDFQGKGARQAEDLEKITQELGGRWSEQFQEEAEAAVEKLREELKNSGRVVEEGKRQLASLAEAKLASLSQATREEYDQQLAQAFGEHAQVMQEAADAEVESIKQAAEQAIAQLQVAEQKRETSFIARAGAAEERLAGVSLAVEALVKDFQGKGARQAEDLEKIAQELGGRWSQQFQEQAEAAVEKLRKELENSGRVVEESKQQLASLAEAKLASLSQATREEYDQQLAQALGEHAQVMQEAADAEVESIKQAAEQAIVQLQAAEQKRETSFIARAGAAEERLAGVSLAVEALVKDFQGKGARQAEDLEKIAQKLGGRWSQQFQEQAEAAVEKLRKELENSGRVVEESKQQLASLAKAKLAALSQVADNAAAGLEAEQRRLKNQCEDSRRQIEDLLEMGWTKPPSPYLQRGNRPNRRGKVAQLALVAGVCLVIMVPLLGVYLSRGTVMQLQPKAPAEFIEQSPNWSAKRRAREEEVAEAYWRVAVVGLQKRYPFGSELPSEPPTEFEVERKYVATSGAKAFSETRARYWENLRRSWVQRESWEERHEWNTQWAARLRHIWEQIRATLAPHDKNRGHMGEILSLGVQSVGPQRSSSVFPSGSSRP